MIRLRSVVVLLCLSALGPSWVHSRPWVRIVIRADGGFEVRLLPWDESGLM